MKSSGTLTFTNSSPTIDVFLVGGGGGGGNTDYAAVGTGQGGNTCEFGDPYGTLYSGGGGGRNVNYRGTGGSGIVILRYKP